MDRSLDRSRFALIPALLFLGIFFFLPLARILTLSLEPGPNLVPGGTFYPRLWAVFQFTVFQAAASTLLTLAFGMPLAFLFARYDFPFKSALRTLTAIPFMLPTVVVAAGFNALLGPRGWLGPLNIPFIGTLGAIFTAHVFYNATIVIRLVGDAWSNLDSRLPDAARVLGATPGQTLWHVTLPLLRPSILAASLMVFLFDFTSYGVILMLGGVQFATLEVEIYLQTLQFLNLPAAAIISIVQLLCTLVLSIIYTRTITHVTSQVKANTLSAPRRRPQNVKEKLLIISLALICFGFYFFPLVSLPLRSLISPPTQATGESWITPIYYQELLINRRGSLFYVPPVQAALNSLTYAGITVFLSLLLGFPAASTLIKPGKLIKWLDPFLMLPLGASAVTLGLGFIITFNKPIPLFSLPFLAHGIIPKSFTLLTSPVLIPIIHTTIALPFVIRNLQTALAAIPERTREAARVLGAAPWQVWLHIDWPIIRRATLSAGAMAFTVSLGEFGAASLLARPEFPTLPSAIFRFLSQPGAMNYGQAMALATLLMLLTSLGILCIETLRPPGGEL